MNLKKYNILTAETIYGLSSIIIECYHHLEHMHHWKMKVCIFRVSRCKYSSIWNACNHRVFISFLNWISYYVGLFVRDGLRCKEEIIIHRLNIGHPRLTYIHHQLICFRLSHERWIFWCYGLLLHLNMMIMIQYPSYYSTIMQVCWITIKIWSLFIMLVMTQVDIS